MPQLEQVLAADPQLACQLRGRDALGDAAKDQEDLRGAQMGPLPGCSREHIEHPPAPFAAVVDDRSVGTAAVDVEAVAGAAPGAGEALGMEQVEELLAAPLLVHQVDDREVHGSGSGRFVIGNPKWTEKQDWTWL